MKTKKENENTRTRIGKGTKVDRRNSGKFVVVKVGRIAESDRRIIRDIIKWEDESAKTDFIISTGRLHVVAAD